MQKFLRIICALVCFFGFTFPVVSQNKTTAVFATIQDTIVLKMDIYQPVVRNDSLRPCVIFVFGGAFAVGARDYDRYLDYFKYLSEKGYVVASIDYRLGLKNATKRPTLFNRKPLINAINMAVADLYSATNYLLQHANELRIDTTMIIASGSSAGAITVLQADYEKRNDIPAASVLPKNFQYGGIIAFSGGIYSTRGKPEYKTTPAPMLFFHGNKDDVVPYNKISLFGTGLFGPKAITKRLKKENHFYCFYTMDGMAHSVSIYPMSDFLPEIDKFIRGYVIEKRPLYVDIIIRDDKRVNPPSHYSETFKKNK